MQDKKTYIRMIFFVLILLWVCWFSVGYSDEIYRGNLSAITDNYTDPSSVNGIYIDGSDFTAIFKVLVFGSNAIITGMFILIICLYSIVVFFAALIPSVIFRLAAMKRTAVITEREYRTCKYIFFGVLAISIIIGMILTHFTGLLYLLLFTLIWEVIVFLLCLYPMRERAKKAESDSISLSIPDMY